MKKTRRWLAMLLAVVLVSSNVIYQLGTNMSASESDSTTEAPQQDDSAEEKAQQEAASNAHKKDSGEAKVQEVNTEEDKNASDTSKKTQVTEKTEKKQEQTAKKADTAKKANAAKKADASSGDTKKDSEEKAYKATIQKSKLDGGDIKAWGSDGKKETVAYTDSKYMKEVKEGDSFNFEITVKNSFKLDKVTDQNNNTIQPKKVDGNVYTYKIADVKSDKTFHVLYKEETNSDKSKTDVNKSGDNKKDDADASDDGESDSKADEDKNVSVASEDGKIATVAATDTTQTIRVGQTVTLDSSTVENGYSTYTHEWTVADGSKVRLNQNSGSSITITGLNAGNTTVTDKYKWTPPMSWNSKSGEKVYNITVRSAVLPTAIAITGADKVTQFKTTQLKANLTPADASGNVTWTSSNEQILSVNDNGLVTAKRQGSATVTASVQGTAKATLSATKTIEVVKNESPSPTNKREALVYYLKDPTKDANSNASSEWGPNPIGTAVVNVEGATWTSGKNCFDNVDQRVVSWPTTLNGNVIPRSNNAWKLIFDAYKTKIERELRVTITEDDVEEISLVPAKISKDNGTTPDMHLDCNVNIKCKKVALIKYWLFDANGTNWEMLGSKNYLVKDGSTTKPSDVTNRSFPTTKTVNGVTYTFSGWYTDQSLTTPAPSFPAQVTGATNYYAKYVAGYQVMYNLAGGKFSDGSTTATEKHNVDTDVVVKEQPTRAGYKFKGWKVEGLSGTTTINSGDTFTMPNGNVTLTAQWEEKDIKDYVTLNTQNVTEEYNGKPHAAGEATAVPKTGKENEVGTLKVEYQKANGDWTTNHEDITAKDVSDSKTVNVRVTSNDLVGELTGTEDLTITKKAVTLTSASDSKTYDGTPLTNDSVTAEGFVGDEGVTTHVNGSQTDAGSSKNTFAKPAYEAKAGTDLNNYDITTKEGTLTVKPVEKEVKVKITGHTDTVTYDGNKHEVTGYDVSIQQDGKAYDKYTTKDFEFTGTAKAEGTDAKTSYQMGLKPEQFKNKSANFTNVTFEVTDGSLTISKRPVTLTSATASKVYDKTPLTKKEVTASTGENVGFVKGQGVTYNVTGSQTEVGDSKNTFTYEPKEGTNLDNYIITKSEGKLTVTADENAIVVTIKGKDKTETYNGTEQSVTGYDVVSIQHDGKAYSKYTTEDFAFSGTAEAKGTDAGSYPMELTKEQFSNTNNNFTNVTFVVTDGNLTISKRDVTLESASAEKEYDGTALESKTVTVTNGSFVKGEEPTYNVTGSQTEVGNSKNTFTYSKDGIDDYSKNYNITKAEGKLKVTPVTDKVTVTITGNTASKKYNGEYHAVSGYTASYSNTLYTAADYSFSGLANINQKDAATYPMGLNAEQFKNTSSNFTNVEFVVTDGQLVITPREVTLTSEGATKVYDGKPLTNNTVTVSGDGFVGEEGATYNVTGSQTNAGSSKNTFTYDLKDNTNEKNYTINKVEGDLVVTQDKEEVVVTITGHTAEAKYDGTAHTAEGYDVSISNTKYHASDFTFKGKENVTQTNAGEYLMGLKESDFVNNSTDFEKVTFVVTDGKLTITKRNVTLTSGTASKVYDGTPLTAKTVSIGGDGFVTDKGEGATCTITGKQTNVGESKNTFVYELYAQNGTDVVNNYNITPVFGTLKVTKQSIDPKDPDNTLGITINDPSDHVYDGKAHQWKPEVKDKNNKKLVEGTDYTVSYDTENFKDVKIIKVTITGTGNYDGTVKKTYQITKRPVTLTSASAEKVYDGNALTKKEVTASAGENEGFVDGEGATYDVTGTQTVVGSSDNTFTYTLKNGTSENNYDIKVANGTLKVTPVTNVVTVTITENSDALTYDGEEHTVKGYKVTDISNKLYKEGDFSFNGNAEVKGTNAGTYNMELKPENFENKSANFSNVKFVIVDGTLKINPKEVTLKSASATKMYDGKPLTKEEVTATGFVGNDGATYSDFASITDVGTTENTFKYAPKAGTIAENYDIKINNGTLEVTPSDKLVTVKIKENSGKETYDGTEKTVTGYTVADISNKLYKEGDFTFSGNAEVKGTNAGTYNMELKPEDFHNTNGNFSNVSFVIEDGTLTIAQRNVTLTSASATKAYDGKPLRKEEVEVSGDGFAEGEGAAYSDFASRTTVGTSDNTFTYTLNNGTNKDNYIITPVPGKLTVTKDENQVVVTITEKSHTVKYNGKEHTVKGYDVTSISNPLYKKTDFTFDGHDEVKGTKAGTYEMKLTSKDFHNTNENFKDVQFNIVDGQLTIQKRTVVMTSATQNKPYDGTALTNNTVTVGGEGFADNEGATYKVTGSQTNVGKSANEFTYDLNKGTDKDNYTIETHNGELEVTPVTDKVTVTIKENSGTVKYDGAAHEVTGYTVESISNTLYTANDFTFSGKAKAEGTDAGTYEMKVNASDFKNISKNFSDVEFVVEDGKLTIEKRKITLTSANDKKVYDGTALTNGKVTVGEDGFADNEGATYKVTGSQTNVGKSDNEFTYTLNEGTKADNYTIETKNGELEVTPVTDKVTVKIKGHTGTFKYDGEKKKVEGYDVTIDNDLYKESDINFKGTDKVEETNANTYAMGLAASDFENISDNFSNVLFEVEDGQLMIEKRNVKLTSATDSKVYDGEALTNDEVTVGGDKFAKGEGATYDVTGTITNKGSVDNEFTYKLNDNTNKDNYSIEVAFGKLSITADKKEVVVTITENSGVEKYDGTAKSVTGYKVTNISNKLYKEKDFTFSGNAKVEATDAGTYDMKLKPEDFANTNENFDKVTFVIVNGTLTIQKRNVTLTSADASQVYNGKALTNDTVTVGGEGFAKGEGATYDVTGTQTNVGESKNTFTYKLNEGTKTDNYVIETAEGTLKVTPVTDEVVVTITGNVADAKYDGKDHTAKGYKVDINNKLYTEDDFTFNGEAEVTGTDAGTYRMDMTSDNFTNNSNNFANVKFVVTNGELNIAKRNVTLTSESDSKAYDGKALTNDEVKVGGDEFAEGEGAEFTVTGSQLDAGTSDNVFEYALKDGTNADNYTIEVVYGKLTVTADENEVVVTITENRGRNKYDGRKHKVTGYEVTDISNKLYTAKDFTFNGKAEVTGTDAGTYNMNVKAADFENTNANFDKVTFVIIDGTLTIEKRNVTMTSANASKQYDGNALTSKKVTVSGEGFAKGEGATYNVTGTRTNTGTSKNTFTYTLKNGTKAANYNIKKVEGKLTITAAAPVTPPNTSNTPANPTPQNRNVVQRVVTSVRNVPSRIAKAVQETGAKVRELVNAGDNNVPLGNQKLDDHKCCVLHFLIMLLTAILYGFFTHNLKKRQKKLFEVREELDTELAKRGLPTTKEQKQQ